MQTSLNESISDVVERIITEERNALVSFLKQHDMDTNKSVLREYVIPVYLTDIFISRKVFCIVPKEEKDKTCSLEEARSKYPHIEIGVSA